MRYYPYGETRSGSMTTDRQFTGQRRDYYIKLYDMGARMCDPELGRFISADSIIPNPANPQSLNRYSYVYNNPLKYHDPSGHTPKWVDFLVGVTYQVANDMSYGAFNAVLSLTVDAFWDTRQSESFYEGQQVGRNVSQAVGTTMGIQGVATAVSGAAAMGPTAGGSLAAALPSGGTSLVIGGIALPAEAGMVIGGTAEAAYGAGIIAYTKLNPLPERGGGAPSRYTTDQRRAMREFNLSKKEFRAIIHDAKSIVEGNPDMIFDLDTGDILDQRSWEWIGSLLDQVGH